MNMTIAVMITQTDKKQFQYSQSNVISNCRKCCKGDLQMLWSRDCSYRSSLSEILECGWSREVGEQVLQESRQMDITDHGYSFD